MHVSVHESRNDEPAAPIDRVGAWIGVANADVLAARDDAALVDQQSTILMTDERPAIADVEMQRILWRVKNGGAKELHYLSARRRTWRTAKKMRSGVAGLSNVNGSPSPNAAMASRKASRTERRASTAALRSLCCP